MYGGESFILWDKDKQALTYYYFTTAGFLTKGTMTFKDGVIHTHETVSGQANGVSEVRGETQMLPNQAFRVKTQYLKNGSWTPGRDTTYRAAPTAKVVFK
jgi:hypothetical protein